MYAKIHSNKCAVYSSGLSLIPKLKIEHVHLTSFSRMRMDIAAQVSQCDVTLINQLAIVL